MSKKLLSESQIRRFMGLAGIKPSQPMKEWYKSNVQEGSYQEDEEELEAGAEDEGEADADLEDEAPEMDDMDDAAPEMEPEMSDAPAEGGDGNAADLAMELIDAMAPVFAQHGVDISTDEDGEAAMDAAPEMPDMDAAMDDMEDEEPMEEGGMSYNKDEKEKMEEGEEELAEVKLELDEESIVNEVARRVAQRILKAQRAKRQLDKALGNK